MAVPTLTPSSTTSAITLTSTGSLTDVNTACPYKVYSQDGTALYSDLFISGAVDQVAYVFKKLGGDVLDIELTTGNIYAAYEEAVLEYSYIVNVHQATNILSDALGNRTGSFDHKGILEAGDLSASLGGNHVALTYPKFDYAMTRRIAEGISAEIGLKGGTIYSGSFNVVADQQDYDLQTILETGADQTTGSWADTIDGKKILIKKVYYKTPHAMWRFFGYYGGLNVVGNLHNFGQFSDDSTFQLVPTWQNKAQALAFEDAIYTRMSHFSYEIRNNSQLRIYPIPRAVGPTTKMWVEFSIPEDVWSGDDKSITGVNNMNTLPLGNLPYDHINAIGKQWIRRYALAICKETLGQIRSKFGGIPIPNDKVTLNGDALLSQAKEEQNALREELKTTLAELTYAKLAESDASMLENSQKVLQQVPNYIFVG